MKNNKIMPSLWFRTVNGSISSIIDYYSKVFGNHFEAGEIISLGTTPSGNTEMCEVQIFGQKYSFMSTAQEHHPFNDAVSFTLQCNNQEEIDAYWDYFTKEGEAVQCGWCNDKYGLRWQVIPYNLGELMSKPQAWEIMMNQKKIVIEEYLR